MRRKLSDQERRRHRQESQQRYRQTHRELIAQQKRVLGSERPCALCGDIFQPRADARSDKGHGLYCSRSCANKVNRQNVRPQGKPGRKMRERYVLLFMPDHPFAKSNGYVYEHRVVVEAALGHYLRTDEHVHHLNHNKTDNRLENLRVLTPSEHMKEHRPEFEDRRLANLRSRRAGASGS